MFTGGSTMFFPDTQTLVTNVQDFGASPGNTAAQNDAAFTSAIAAVAGGGAVLIPFGTYNKSTSIIIDNDNISLIGLGTRLGSPTIQILGADPTFALVVGNTKNVNNVLIEGLNFQGLANSTSTGGGINFRCVGGKLKQVRVANFGGTGVNLAAVSSTIFEDYLEDVTLIQNGRNTVTPGDNLVIANTVTDFECIRVISLGNAAKNTTRHCINCAGGPGKFLVCHEYFANQDGIHITGNGNIEIIGGEHETNGNDGINIVSTTNPTTIHGAHCFGNAAGTDIASSGPVSVIGCMIESVNNGIYATFATGVIADNYCVGQAAKSIWLDTGCATMSVHDNYIQNGAPAIQIAGTSNAIHDNLCVAAGITEVAGANTNDIHDNVIGGGTITIVGTATKVRNNPGVNPKGSVSAPGIPASTTPLTNQTGFDCSVFITANAGGTTAVSIGGVSTTVTIAAAGVAQFRVPVGQSITLTYTSAPTWVWFGD